LIYEKLMRHTQGRLETLGNLPPGVLQGYKDHLNALQNSVVAVLERELLEESYQSALSSTPKPFEPTFEGGLFLDFQESLPIRFSEPAGPDQFIGSPSLLEALGIFRGHESCPDKSCVNEHPYLILNFYLDGTVRIGLKTYDENFPHFTFETPFRGCCPAHSLVCPTEFIKPRYPEGTSRLCGADMQGDGRSSLRQAAPLPCPTAISCEILMRFALRLLENLRDQKRLPA